MPLLHDPAVRRRLESRLAALRSDSPRKWGNMSVDQMLWHVNQFLGADVGETTLESQKNPMPLPLLKFAVIYLPWPKSAPTHLQAVPKSEHNFEAEKARCLALIARFVAKPIDGPWPPSGAFGPQSGKFASKLQAKHLDHHFKQFSA
jgi:hypothetical protein